MVPGNNIKIQINFTKKYICKVIKFLTASRRLLPNENSRMRLKICLKEKIQDDDKTAMVIFARDERSSS